uniref:Uncharacterized protein n=1 Tax=Candidatus Kentrum sp. FM TaxID=2126340 RepID=A0A450VQW5_9GAMM|nr:MAG: hypothetical protein BECKFM1743B_GA0114221_1003315 [Candidatus Kentron sp. FM]
MADQCNYTSEIDMDARMSGANTRFARTLPRTYGRILYSPIMLGFALMPKSCGFTTLCYRHFADQPGIR